MYEEREREVDLRGCRTSWPRWLKNANESVIIQNGPMCVCPHDFLHLPCGPDPAQIYNCTYIRWTTHRPEGLSLKDTTMAAICDELAQRFGEIEGPNTNSPASDLIEQIANGNRE